jgi:hypothetical protein
VTTLPATRRDQLLNLCRDLDHEMAIRMVEITRERWAPPPAPPAPRVPVPLQPGLRARAPRKPARRP